MTSIYRHDIYWDQSADQKGTTKEAIIIIKHGKGLQEVYIYLANFTSQAVLEIGHKKIQLRGTLGLWRV
jgi:hypothetical protein